MPRSAGDWTGPTKRRACVKGAQEWTKRNLSATTTLAAPRFAVLLSLMTSFTNVPIDSFKALERIPQSELKRSRAAGTEKLPRCFKRAIETRRVDRIAESRVVPVGRARMLVMLNRLNTSAIACSECGSFKWKVLVIRMSNELKSSPKWIF